MEEDIRRLAYRLWEQAGRPFGDGVAFWLAAERLVQGKPQKKLPKIALPLFPVHWDIDPCRRAAR